MIPEKKRDISHPVVGIKENKIFNPTPPSLPPSFSLPSALLFLLLHLDWTEEKRHAQGYSLLPPPPATPWSITQWARAHASHMAAARRVSGRCKRGNAERVFPVGSVCLCRRHAAQKACRSATCRHMGPLCKWSRAMVIVERAAPPVETEVLLSHRLGSVSSEAQLRLALNTAAVVRQSPKATVPLNSSETVWTSATDTVLSSSTSSFAFSSPKGRRLQHDWSNLFGQELSCFHFHSKTVNMWLGDIEKSIPI